MFKFHVWNIKVWVIFPEVLERIGEPFVHLPPGSRKPDRCPWDPRHHPGAFALFPWGGCLCLWAGTHESDLVSRILWKICLKVCFMAWGNKEWEQSDIHTQNNFHKAPLSHHSKTVFFSQMPSQSIALDIIVDKTFLIILIFSYSNTGSVFLNYLYLFF